MLRLWLLLAWQLTLGETQRRVRKAGLGMVGRRRQLRPTCRPTRRLRWQPL